MLMAVSIALVFGFSLAGGIDGSDTEAPESLLAEGAKIRFWTPLLAANPNIAEIKEIRADEIVVVLEEREGLYRVRFPDLERVEVSMGGGKNYALPFAAIGALGLGLFFGLASEGLRANSNDTGSASGYFIGGLLVGGTAGALLGWALSSGEQWEEVPSSFYGIDAGRRNSPGSVWAVRVSF